MVKAGDADAMVAGVAHPDGARDRGGHDDHRPRRGHHDAVELLPHGAGRTASSSIADCAVNADPTAEQLADIALASAASYRALLRRGAARRAALLLHQGQREARARRQGDAGARTRARSAHRRSRSTASCRPTPRWSPRSRRRRCKARARSPGRANVLVFPDLDAGNIAYKLTQYLARRARHRADPAGIRAADQRPLARRERRGHRRHRGHRAARAEALCTPIGPRPSAARSGRSRAAPGRCRA